MVIEGIIDRAIIVAARRAFHQAYSHCLDGAKHEDVLSVGDRRLLITIRLEPPLDDPQFFANSNLLPILSAATTPAVAGEGARGLKALSAIGG